VIERQATSLVIGDVPDGSNADVIRDGHPRLSLEPGARSTARAVIQLPPSGLRGA